MKHPVDQLAIAQPAFEREAQSVRHGRAGRVGGHAAQTDAMQLQRTERPLDERPDRERDQAAALVVGADEVADVCTAIAAVDIAHANRPAQHITVEQVHLQQLTGGLQPLHLSAVPNGALVVDDGGDHCGDETAEMRRVRTHEGGQRRSVGHVDRAQREPAAEVERGERGQQVGQGHR